jgi:hypothetical protein
MTKKPLKNWNHWGISPGKNNQFKSRVRLESKGLAVWLPAMLLLMLFSRCNSSQSYRMIDSPFPVTDSWGKARPYRVYLPPLDKPMPMMLYFHGVMSDGFKTIPSLKNYTGSPVEETGLIGFCKRNGIILVVPEAVYSYEFLGQAASGWLPFEKECPGIEKIIDVLVKRYPVSANHIYLTGISAGAGLCHHLANRRPWFYNAILSHSQGYVDRDSQLLKPAVPGPQFGVVFCYNRGDYKNLIDICLKSERIYREAGYRTVLLKNLPPENHSWSSGSNRRFWRYLLEVGRAGYSTQRSGSHP